MKIGNCNSGTKQVYGSTLYKEVGVVLMTKRLMPSDTVGY